MATYAIGDIQGCYNALEALLHKLQFNPARDKLWFTGDLVNRGPDSLKTLRFIKSLGANAISVLGNHDLSFLAIAHGVLQPQPGDTLNEILQAPDREELVDWLKKKPLMHIDKNLNFTILHAGLHPDWSISFAKQLAEEVENKLKSKQAKDFLQNMYGNEPSLWSNKLTNWERLRFITNVFTRIRYCTKNGELNLTAKGPLSECPPGYEAWFNIPNSKWNNSKIIFGHWASLKGECKIPNLYALDTGCIWGGCLTALCLETEERFQIECEKF